MKEKYNEIIKFLKQYQEDTNVNGYVFGCSGGKDSTIVAKLLVDAIGKENVLGVLMPNGEQKDIKDSVAVCRHLGIDWHTVNIQEPYNAVIDSIHNIKPSYMFDVGECGFQTVLGKLNSISDAAKINIGPRLRALTLYTIAQTLGYRVAGTGNKSEQFTGWCTKWGDMACDINPIVHLTCTEVIALGDYMKLPYDLVHKTPADGLTGMSDEEKFGFTYGQLDSVIEFHDALETGVETKIPDIDSDTINNIMNRYNNSRHKFAPYTILNYKK
jgi:NAD+ synthase